MQVKWEKSVYKIWRATHMYLHRNNEKKKLREATNKCQLPWIHSRVPDSCELYGRLFHTRIKWAGNILQIKMANISYPPAHINKNILFYFKIDIKQTWRGCSFWRVCLSAARSQSAGGASPVSDSLIPVSSLTRCTVLVISSSTFLIERVYGPWPCYWTITINNYRKVHW